MLFTLRPLILESQGLNAALQAMAEKMRETFSLNVIINVDENILNDMEMGKQGVIFYIIEEATNNARKHANAPHIWVRLRSFESGIGLLEIEDDGLGFDVAAVNKSYDKRGSASCDAADGSRLSNNRGRSGRINNAEGVHLEVAARIAKRDPGIRPGRDHDIVAPVPKPGFPLWDIRYPELISPP